MLAGCFLKSPVAIASDSLLVANGGVIRNYMYNEVLLVKHNDHLGSRGRDE